MSYNLCLKRFSGKVAIVTGASAGIGKAIVEALVKEGVIVAGIARRIERVEEHAKQLNGEKGKLQAYQCDLTNEKQILSTFNRITTELGPVHILINNAGLGPGSDIIDGEIDKWRPTIDTNFIALTILMSQAVQNMKIHRTKGHIVNMNSVYGHTVRDLPELKLGVYAATKYAVTAATETVRLEINRAKLPIKITSISPGFVHTEFQEAIVGEEKGKEMKAQRPGLVSEDISDAVMYVLSTPERVNVKELTISIQGELS